MSLDAESDEDVSSSPVVDSDDPVASSTIDAVAPTQSTAASADEWRSLADEARAMGYDGQAQDDRAVLTDLINARRQAAAMQQYAQMGQYVAPHIQDFQRWRQEQAQRAQQPQPVQQPVKPEPFFKMPDFDPSMERFLTRDPASGRIVAVPGADPTLPQKYEEFKAAERQAMQQLLREPDKFADWAYQQHSSKIEQMVEQRVQQALQGYQATTSAQQFIQQNMGALFHVDQAGQPVRDAMGNHQLSQQGQVFLGLMQEAVQLGIQDPEARKNYALRLLPSYLPQQQQSAEPLEDANANHKQAFIADNNRHVPNRGGTVEAAKGNNRMTQNPSHDLRDMLQQAFKQHGLLQPSST